MIAIAIVLGQAFEDLDFFPLLGLLGKARDHADLRVTTVSAHPSAVSKLGVVMACEDRLPSASPDVLVVPGAADFSPLISSKPLVRLITAHVGQGRPVFTVCSGVELLDQLAMVDGFLVSRHFTKHRLASRSSEAVHPGPRDSGQAVTTDRWLTSVGGDGSLRYLKSVECFFAIGQRYFPAALAAVHARAEIASVLSATHQ